jgi:hypothetical protein
MIDQVDRQLKEWVSTVLQEVEVRLEAPKIADQARGIVIYLMDITALPPPSGTRIAPLQVALRYLVTSWSEDPEEAHRLLGELLFAAMENPEFQVEPESVPVESWKVFGVPPRPSFVLRVPLRRERTELKAKPVLAVPVVRTVSALGLYGIVRGPNDVPLAGAEVDVPALRLTTHTNQQGGFYFAAVPGEGQIKTLRVKAKGRELNLSTREDHPDASRPLLIRFDKMED